TPVTRSCDLKIYMSMVLRINPTARPSISNGSPGSTMMVWKSGFSGCSSIKCLLRRKRFTVTSSPSRATTIWPFRTSLEICTASRSPSMMPASRIHMPLRENRRACCDPPDQGQGQLGQALQRQGKLLEAGLVDGAQRITFQADAARGATDEFDRALAGQRLQMLFGRVRGLEAELGRDFGARGRRTRAGDGALDQVQNLLLAGGELDGERLRLDHDGELLGLRLKQGRIAGNCLNSQ